MLILNGTGKGVGKRKHFKIYLKNQAKNNNFLKQLCFKNKTEIQLKLMLKLR